jgi:hypothetical protein
MSGSQNFGNTGANSGGSNNGAGNGGGRGPARTTAGSSGSSGRSHRGGAVGTESTSIHRLLDEAFAGVTMTPETYDLKEEIRGNLADRAAELQAGGLTSGQAATAAFAELGDIRELFGDDGYDIGDESDDDSGGRYGDGREIARRTRDSGGNDAYAGGAIAGRSGVGSTPRLGTTPEAGFGATPGARPGSRPGSRLDASPGARPGSNSTPGAYAATAFRLNHVPPNPAFVVRTVILSLLLAAAVALVVSAAVGAPWMSAALTVASVTIATLAVGLIVADSLRQTTSQNYPLPGRRAAAYGLSAAVMLLGLLLGAVFISNTNAVALLIAGVLLVVVGIVGFTWLGVTQTNRSKPWVQAMNEQYIAEDRFSQDPAAAARFGIYTVVIWVLAFAVFAILSLTVGFLWSWLALLAGLVVFFLTLARMLFAVR